MITNLNPVKKPDFYFAHYCKRFIYDTIKILKDAIDQFNSSMASWIEKNHNYSNIVDTMRYRMYVC